MLHSASTTARLPRRASTASDTDSGLAPLVAKHRYFVHTYLKKMFEQGLTRAEGHKLVDVAADHYAVLAHKPNGQLVSVSPSEPVGRQKGVVPPKKAAGLNRKSNRKTEEIAAAAVFNTRLGGKKLGNVRFGELSEMASRLGFEARFAALLLKHKPAEATDSTSVAVLGPQIVNQLRDKADR